MTGKLLPFAPPAPPPPEQTLVTRERTGGGLSYTLTIGVEAIDRELAKAKRSGAPLEEIRSPPDETDQVDRDGFLCADDDGPEGDG